MSDGSFISEDLHQHFIDPPPPAPPPTYKGDSPVSPNRESCEDSAAIVDIFVSRRYIYICPNPYTFHEHEYTDTYSYRPPKYLLRNHFSRTYSLNMSDKTDYKFEGEGFWRCMIIWCHLLKLRYRSSRLGSI